VTKPVYAKTSVGEVCNDVAPGPMNTFSAVADLNGDGRPDIVLCGRNGRMVWLENRGGATGWWPEHLIDVIDGMECGGSPYDLTGDGLPDVINGGDYQRSEIYWWRNPGAAAQPGQPWVRRVIASTGATQFHDTLIADVTGDGRPALIFTNQLALGGTTIFRVPLPTDPTASPWPGLEVIASAASVPNPLNPHRSDGRQPEEGLAAGDLDGDGVNELVCGTHWYKYVDGAWQAHPFASQDPLTGYLCTKIAVGDVDGDGRNEIVLAEGDPCVYGKTQGGKLAWFKPGEDITALWGEHVIEDGLLDAHTLQLADLCGNGWLDILTGEVGMADPITDTYLVRPPRLMIYENGQGRFTRHILDEGTGIHEAVLADMAGKGAALDIVGKPLHGPEKWHVHVYCRR
jgi:hypothetical protein